MARFPLLVSFLAAVMGELGDKSQLLVLLLAGYFQRPVPVIAGSVLACLANNAVSVLAGGYFRSALGQRVSRPVAASIFFVLALWALKNGAGAGMPVAARSLGPLLATLLSYFLADLGDKTQLATVALAASYDAPLALIAGSTLGSLTVDVPTILLAGANPPWARISWAHYVFAGLFAVLGVMTVFHLPRRLLGQFSQRLSVWRMGL
jgi:Ca2+/H+ antiporter, TMEM165/GDT1 family